MDTETMNKAAEQASTVARALPYLRRYSGATTGPAAPTVGPA